MGRSEQTVWTIGHSNRTLDNFVTLIRSQKIEVAADVRRFPGSRRHPHFNQESLAVALAEHGVDYCHFPGLGGRRKSVPGSRNSAWRNEAFRGYADYMETEEFRSAVAGLFEGAEKQRTALMCAEALWWQCHRSLIADYLKAGGWRVLHILGLQKTEEHRYTEPARICQGKLTYEPIEQAELALNTSTGS